MFVKFLTDPEYKTAVWGLRTVYNQSMRYVWRDQHYIARTDAISLLSDLHTNVTFDEKIELKIVVRVGFHFCKVFVVIIIKFEISGQHILSRFKGGL